ncbi:response regulator transcription factor [Stenotrophomonas sp.]|uniref:response regulator transcription factor n=1 Tax=Stenotrophomonas sp. TaxID=69392 RepID=UPI0028ADD19A|nr:response regulator transcription factor [Stenotrophomonas sp.]
MRILLIERDREVASKILDYFEARGHQLDTIADGVAGLHFAASNGYDAVVIDWMLPRMEGPEVLRRLRLDHGVSVPVVMLAARVELSDKIIAFRSGADDYVTKPFDLPELEVRLEALVSRTEGRVTKRRLLVGDLTLDLSTLEATRAGKRLHLYPACRKLLEVLMRASPAAVTRRQLEHTVWGDNPPDEDLLRSQMSSLRRSIDGPFEEKMIQTLPRVGYRLVAASFPAIQAGLSRDSEA